MHEPCPPDASLVRRMVNSLRHRGPDEFGAYLDNRCVLGQARLSIIDLSGGSQPMCNEDGSLWITFNGEIFNYLELRDDLAARGHVFRTRCDTEVIIHAFEEWGPECLHRFNGQFALILYNRADHSVFFARDRLGIRPLFYAIHNGRFYFASEIKAIFCDPGFPRRLDLKGLDEIFTWWTTAPPRTAFEGVNELEAGSCGVIRNGAVSVRRYWEVRFPESFDRRRSLASWAEELHALLVDSVRLRLRADVPVGAYLSGGLDSSAITALIKRFTDTRVESFSIAFQDKAYDESGFQRQMAAHLGTNHHVVTCTYRDIAESFPDVIRHTERTILRTAPTPLFLLSRLVRQNDFKVVLTGEGSDEILGGYDLFKETLIRRFWARRPDSAWRPALLKRLYPTLPLTGGRAKFYLETFYRAGLTDLDNFAYSHQPRLNTTTRIKDYFTPAVREQIASHDSLGAFGRDLPESFLRWHHLCRAQYLEARSLLSGYLLSSQGDRVGMAHSVEGRFPFLDYRVVEFAAAIPPSHKLLGLKEKLVLKKAMAAELPPEIIARVKQPYMAPDSNCFVQPDSPEWIADVLSVSELRRTGLFDPEAVQVLRDKAARLKHAHLSFKDNMSMIGVLSTQLLVRQFIDRFETAGDPGRGAFSVWLDHSAASDR